MMAKQHNQWRGMSTMIYGTIYNVDMLLSFNAPAVAAYRSQCLIGHGKKEIISNL